MRVIAGKYRGRNLKSPPSLEVRPTSDRLRETLFNVIAPRIKGTRFLDLCAGSGAVGIEALSRGATHVTFVDRSRRMCLLVKSNLDLCRIEANENEVVLAKAHDYLRRVTAKSSGAADSKNELQWDIVFFDPPYASDYFPTLDLLGSHSSSLLTEAGLVIVEHRHKNELQDEVGRIIRSRTLKQGDSALSFYQVTS